MRGSEIARFAHGTTVGTNAVLEEKGSPAGLIVTRGFRAVYELRAGTRPSGGALLDPYYAKPRPLIAQSCIEEISERILHDGTRTATPRRRRNSHRRERLLARGVRSIAVCYLFSFMDAGHERFTAEVIRSVDPSIRVSLSSDILPVIREYPRIATTVLDAYVGPIIERYLDSLEAQLDGAGITTPQKYVMQSHGGLMRLDVGKQFPNQTLLSGPAAGVIFGRRLGELIDAETIVTFDMGRERAPTSHCSARAPPKRTAATSAATISPRRCCASRRSAPAAERSAGSVTAVCSRRVRTARARRPDRRVTVAAAPKPRSPMPMR